MIIQVSKQASIVLLLFQCLLHDTTARHNAASATMQITQPGHPALYTKATDATNDNLKSVSGPRTPTPVRVSICWHGRIHCLANERHLHQAACKHPAVDGLARLGSTIYIHKLHKCLQMIDKHRVINC